jgi:hypothetical protein
MRRRHQRLKRIYLAQPRQEAARLHEKMCLKLLLSARFAEGRFNDAGGHFPPEKQPAAQVNKPVAKRASCLEEKI